MTRNPFPVLEKTQFEYGVMAHMCPISFSASHLVEVTHIIRYCPCCLAMIFFLCSIHHVSILTIFSESSQLR